MVTIVGKGTEDVGKDVGKSVGKGVGKELKGTLSEVYRLIMDNPEITVPELAKITGHAGRTIERSLARLKELKLITRAGGRTSGHWVINREH
ncbi:MAG: winged helix-turn-helix transcriptional regulator [Bacteroidales bacterium]